MPLRRWVPPDTLVLPILAFSKIFATHGPTQTAQTQHALTARIR